MQLQNEIAELQHQLAMQKERQDIDERKKKLEADGIENLNQGARDKVDHFSQEITIRETEISTLKTENKMKDTIKAAAVVAEEVSRSEALQLRDEL